MRITGSSEIELFNLQDNAHVVSPCLIIHGKCLKSVNARMMQVSHPQLPPVTYPINEQFFKATIILTPGENVLTFVTDTNVKKTVTCFYTPMLQNPPVHLCLLLAKDSPLQYDCPKVQKEREGGNGLELAIQKMKIGARLMQAFTNEQMLRNGFGDRTFRFEEEFGDDPTFRQSVGKRNSVKIHLIRSDKTTKELRDHNLAQQNPKASDAGGLFGIAMDALRKYGGPFNDSERPAQAAVMFLDTHWDGEFITAHAALGGGDDRIKLAIFGSHGLFSWPTCIEDLVAYFTDDTRTSTSEVANDSNECGTHWETINVTLGAFMHEIGHLLGCPHQVDGVMLRDYVRLNRSFLTKEGFSAKTNSYGAQPPIYPKEECTWNRLDLVRFLHHPSFTLPKDYYDLSFLRPGKMCDYVAPKPSLYPIGKGECHIVSQTGVYLIEIIGGDLARASIEYLPKSIGGPGAQNNIIVSLQDLRSRLPSDQLNEFGNSFKLKILSINASEVEVSDFPSFLDIKPIPMAQYGFSNRVMGIKSQLFGNPTGGQDVGIIPFDVRKVTALRVYHGGALDGIRVFVKEDTQVDEPPVPPRNYINKLAKSFKAAALNDKNTKSVLFGKQTDNYSDVVLEPGEYVTGFNVRSGCWVDAIQVLTSYGRVTAVLGSGGGGLGELSPPAGQYILGFQGRIGQWVDAFGIVYGTL